VPLFSNIPELFHPLSLVPTAYPSGYPSFAARDDQAPRLEVMVAALPPSSWPPASQIFPPLVDIEDEFSM
jgi:hypothetical protein